MGHLYNLGCGLTAPVGWVNIDRSPNLLLDRVKPAKQLLCLVGVLTKEHMVKWPRNITIRDIRKGIPCHDGEADAIYSSHTLEHLYFDEANAILDDCFRALRPGGVMRVALPNGQEFARLGASGDPEEAREFNRRLCAHPMAAPSRRQQIVRLLASPPHRWQPVPSLVREMFREAGFASPEERKFLDSAIQGIEDVEHREASFFVEAVR